MTHRRVQYNFYSTRNAQITRMPCGILYRTNVILITQKRRVFRASLPKAEECSSNDKCQKCVILHIFGT